MSTRALAYSPRAIAITETDSLKWEQLLDPLWAASVPPRTQEASRSRSVDSVEEEFSPGQTATLSNRPDRARLMLRLT